jgi:hypothetical protein
MALDVGSGVVRVPLPIRLVGFERTWAVGVVAGISGPRWVRVRARTAVATATASQRHIRRIVTDCLQNPASGDTVLLYVASHRKKSFMY